MLNKITPKRIAVFFKLLVGNFLKLQLQVTLKQQHVVLVVRVKMRRVRVPTMRFNLRVNCVIIKNYFALIISLSFQIPSILAPVGRRRVPCLCEKGYRVIVSVIIRDVAKNEGIVKIG